jgi:hypothetical protein
VRHYFTQSDVDELVAAAEKPSFQGVDLLLSSVAPHGIYKGVAPPPGQVRT